MTAILATIVGVCFALVLVLPHRQGAASVLGVLLGLSLFKQPELPTHIVQLSTDRCSDCQHTRGDHSQILGGAPCLDCECFAWAEPEPEPEPVGHHWPEYPTWGSFHPSRGRVLPSTSELQHYRTHPSTLTGCESWQDGETTP